MFEPIADREFFYQRGSYFDNFFFSWWGEEEPNTSISGQSSARQRNAAI